MVANGYALERTINVVLAIFCSFLSLLQIRATSLAGNAGKKRIHLCGGLALAFWILANIDPQGVYGMMPMVLVSIFTQWALDSISAALCFIIFSHFQVHYASIHRDLPKFLRPALLVGVAWLVTVSTIMHILEFQLNLLLFDFLDGLTNLIFIASILIGDLYGYYLIRTVLRELHRAILETSTPKQLRSTGQRNSLTDHQITLRRIFRFHFCISILLIIDLIDRIGAISNDLPNWNHTPTIADPNNYTLNAAIFPIFLVWSLETWWAWTPIRSRMEDVGENTEGTHGSHYSPFAKVDSNANLPSMTAEDRPDALTKANSEVELEIGIQTPSKQGSENDIQQEPQYSPQDSPM